MATVKQQMEFIEEIAPLIRLEAKKRGYKTWAGIIAQACLESAYGTCKLAKHHNYFGMKCGSSWKGIAINAKTNEEYTKGTLTQITAAFRGYTSMAAGVTGYFDFISTKRYANLKDATNAREYLSTIKADGYATDSKYVEKNMAVVDKFNLTAWEDVVTCTTVEFNPDRILKKGCKGEDVGDLQWLLNTFGYDLKVDGDFGKNTDAAVRDFQKAHGLVVDGKVGPKTIAVLTA